MGPKGKATEELPAFIKEKLEATWSPQQIVDRHLMGMLSTKSIYRWLYAGILGVGTQVLRHKGKRHKPAEARGKFQVGISIHKRLQRLPREKP